MAHATVRAGAETDVTTRAISRSHGTKAAAVCHVRGYWVLDHEYTLLHGSTVKIQGILGEAIVLEHERLLLERLGRPDLAAKISHVAQVNAAAGFDILSYTEDDAEKFIEVKTTTTDSETFEITSNEWTVARQRGRQYWVYHVLNVREPIPSIKKLHDPSSLVDLGRLLLRPTSFQVVPTESSET